jgi:uncharacterized protein
MSLGNILLLLLTAFVGGTLNSVAGGGSFFTLPALIFTGVPAKIANATSTVALWPGSVASIGAYRRELRGLSRSLLILLIGTSLIGGLLGALLLLKTSSIIFEKLLPYLLLLATLLFTFSPMITARLHVRQLEKAKLTTKNLLWISIIQFIIAIYGGYFGGGIGIMMLASLSVMGFESIHVMNAVKTMLASCINGIAVIAFIIAGAVFWPQALLMTVAATIGGYGGAYYARKINPKYIRIFVIIVGFIMTIVFFIKQP